MGTARLSLLFAAAAIAAAVAVSLFMVWREGPAGGGSGVALIGGDFRMVDHTGRTVTGDDFAGRYRLVYFGFTYCPDVCPTELQNMTVALDQLGPLADRIVPIFVTVDPVRDDVATMAAYVEHFHPSFVGLTGSVEQVAATARTFRVYYAKVGDDPDAYLMDHSSYVYLMDRDGVYVTHFTPNTPPEQMAERIRRTIAS